MKIITVIAQHVSPEALSAALPREGIVDRVVEGVAFARGAGLLGDARAWICAEAADLFAAVPRAAVSA